jgi:molybdopterin-guanine dinucleotide biosynthesis protein A
VAALCVAGLLLAGGEARRMGGCDKGWQLLDGRALVQHVLARLVPQVDTVVISANRTLADYRQLGWPVVCDAEAWRGMGPLAGLASALRYLPSSLDAVQLMPCDTPLLPDNLVARLSQVLLDDPFCRACYPESTQGPEPGMLLVRMTALNTLDDYLAHGGRSLRGWLAQLAARRVTFDTPQAFANANDPVRLQQLDQQLRRARVHGAEPIGQKS